MINNIYLFSSSVDFDPFDIHPHLQHFDYDFQFHWSFQKFSTLYQARRESNLRALEDARNIINVDNADEIHEQLSKLAMNADAAAGKLVQMTSSTSIMNLINI